MRTFTFKRWSGASDTVEGVDVVEFGAAHVVFYAAPEWPGAKPRIIRAERVENVNGLVESTGD